MVHITTYTVVLWENPYVDNELKYTITYSIYVAMIITHVTVLLEY